MSKNLQAVLGLKKLSDGAKTAATQPTKASAAVAKLQELGKGKSASEEATSALASLSAKSTQDSAAVSAFFGDEIAEAAVTADSISDANEVTIEIKVSGGKVSVG